MNRNAPGEKKPTFLFVSSICIRIRLGILLPCSAKRLLCKASFLDSCFTFSIVLRSVMTLTRAATFRTRSFTSSPLDWLACTGTFRCSLRNLIFHLTTFPKRCMGLFSLWLVILDIIPGVLHLNVSFLSSFSLKNCGLSSFIPILKEILLSKWEVC